MPYLKFISDKCLKKLILDEVVKKYDQALKKYDLNRFYSNKIDPIKFTFDSEFFNIKIEKVIEKELMRQRDKKVNNAVGKFHHNVFKCINGWFVPNSGFDIINSQNTIFVEIKNKHNTMNSSSAEKTYLKMLRKVAESQNNKCFLVEVIAKKSQNIIWTITIDGEKYSNDRIRKISLDKFYEIVTGQKEAFKNLISAILEIIKDISKERNLTVFSEKDTVVEELKKKNSNILQQLFLDTFYDYNGFCNNKKSTLK